MEPRRSLIKRRLIYALVTVLFTVQVIFGLWAAFFDPSRLDCHNNAWKTVDYSEEFC